MGDLAIGVGEMKHRKITNHPLANKGRE
jgi:hypothetical protein